MRLLVVEDDADLRRAMVSSLNQADFEVEAVADGVTALNMLMMRDYDLAIIDLGLPGMDGLAVVRSLRGKAKGLPILIVTARDALGDRVSGLDAGADDYLIKPFELAEFEARVRALLRRHRADRDTSITIGALSFTPGQPRVMLANTPVDLPAGEAALLELLVLRSGKVVRKTEISDRLARNGEPLSDTAIEICIYRLRRRLGPYGLKVQTLRGFGYRLDASSS